MGAVAAMDELIDRIVGSGLLSAEAVARADLDPSAAAPDRRSCCRCSASG
jgi:hypothetical protein